MDTIAEPHNDVLERGQRAHWWKRLGTKENGFRYVDSKGRKITNHEQLERIKALAVPPAWSDVHVSPHPMSRLQAIGLDGKGRPQYLYHDKFSARQQRHKFEKIERFGEYLPHLRRLTSEHIRDDGFTKRRILAIVTRLVNSLYFRAGSDEGVRKNKTYGITTLRSRHVRVEADGRLYFNFEGKHHVQHRKVLVDQTLAIAVAQLKGLHGSKLFQYRNGDGRFHAVTGHDLNLYIKGLTAPEFSAKDFRTWHGTLIVAQELARTGKAETKKDLKRNVVQAVKRAAEHLGNTPAVCRRSYLHPMILSLYEKGITLQDVPLTERTITATEQGQFPEELQLLELFHIGRVLAAERSRKAKPLLTPAPVWRDQPAIPLTPPPVPMPLPPSPPGEGPPPHP